MILSHIIAHFSLNYFRLCFIDRRQQQAVSHLTFIPLHGCQSFLLFHGRPTFHLLWSECIHCGNACSKFLTNTLPTGIHVHNPHYFDLNWTVLYFSGFVVTYLRPATDLRNWLSVVSSFDSFWHPHRRVVTAIILHTFNSVPNGLQFDIWEFFLQLRTQSGFELGKNIWR